MQELLGVLFIVGCHAVVMVSNKRSKGTWFS